MIPTLDEAKRIVGAVASALDSPSFVDRPAVGARNASPADSSGEGGVPAGRGESDIEVVVVDGGSDDETVALAQQAGARVLRLSDFPAASSSLAGAEATGQGVVAGRAHQLRLGSEKTEGEVILFLHADTRLPAGWSREVERILADPGIAGGAFTFRFLERGGWERWIEWWVARRVSVFRLPYGDQALFVRRSVLTEMGGVAIVPMMEDLDLVRGIKRAGRLAISRLPATTSSRRYRSRGTLRTIFWHQVALLGWYLNVDRARLAARMGR